MDNKIKEQIYQTLVRQQHNNYQGYPEWYAQELLKNEPIPITKFGKNYQLALDFYLKQVNKLFFANTVLNTQLNAALTQKKQLAELISNLEEIERQSQDQRKKRVRRCASQIERKYICQVLNCDKSYGTEGSMAQHMRLKHPNVEYNPLLWGIEPSPIKEEKIRRVKVKNQSEQQQDEKEL